MKIILTPAAEADLTNIGDYIAADNPIRARSFVRELRQKIRQIGATPLGFPLVPRYEHSDVRRRVFGNYLIFYRIETDRIFIIHILHGSRDHERLLFPGG